MKILVEAPPTRLAERRYACGVVLGEWLGLEWRLEVGEREHVRISSGDPDRGSVVMPDSFLGAADRAWLSAASLPRPRPAHADLDDLPGRRGPAARRVPLVAGEPGAPIEIRGATVRIPFDVLGTAFMMLSRYEEWVLEDRDEHDRFPAAASMAARGGFLDRPIVDEQVDVLAWALRRVVSDLPEVPRSAHLRISCDVDRPFDPDASAPTWLVRRMAGDLIRRGSPRSAVARIGQFVDARRGDRRRDPFNTFDWMMGAAERGGHRITFNLMAARNPGPWDARYRIGDPWIRSLLRSIHRRGHGIGLHGSYDSGPDAGRLRAERESLQRILDEEGIDRRVVENRQHYLRWSPRRSAVAMEDAGIRFDSTLGFSDRPGFRCGTCREFPMFDLAGGRPLRLRQRPLVCMECAVLGATPRGRDAGADGARAIRSMREACVSVGGDFTLLWHNSRLRAPEERRLFERVASEPWPATGISTQTNAPRRCEGASP